MFKATRTRKLGVASLVGLGLAASLLGAHPAQATPSGENGK
jgi:hypothetical protein